MGVDPPFLYAPPSRYSFTGPTDKGFNPRAATISSWTTPAPRTKHAGPLINFNKHPDSVSKLNHILAMLLISQQYVIVPYGHVDAQPMSPRTRNKVKYLRQSLLGLRVCALLGAVGTLFCGIAINGTAGSVGWIIRVAPAIAVLHTLYAVYHLHRSPTGRTPASSASYMLFAAMLDTGLIPLLIVTALIAHTEYLTRVYSWGTLFGTPAAAYTIIYALFLLSVTEGALLVTSLIIGIYLAVLFRKIAKLPPDMNPLEPNLTARPHKRNKSELIASDKHLSGSTLASSERMSGVADPLVAPARRMPFMHTRLNSTDSIGLYKDHGARMSQVDFPGQGLYQHGNTSFRVSRPSDINQIYQPTNGSVHSPQNNSHQNSPESHRKPLPNRMIPELAALNNTLPTGPGCGERHSRKNSLGRGERWSSSLGDWKSIPTLSPTPFNPKTPANNDENIAPVPSVSPLSNRGLSPDPAYNVDIQSWYVSPNVKAKHSEEYLAITQSHITSPQQLQGYQERHRAQTFEYSARSRHTTNEDELASRNPLGMNPPTPVNDENHPPTPTHTQMKEQRAILQEADINVPEKPSISKGSSFVGSGGKTRYYGNLRSSIGSIHSSTEKNIEVLSDSASNYSRSETMKSGYSALRIDRADAMSDAEFEDKSHCIAGDVDVSATVHDRDDGWRGGRQVSSTTGFDLRGGYAGLGAEFGRGMGRRRDVSGKVAEEGRGRDGVLHEADFHREVTVTPGPAPAPAPALALAQKGGAAGWARFKGL